MTSVWARALSIGLVGVAAGALVAVAAGGIGAGRQSAEPATGSSAQSADGPTPASSATEEEPLAETEAYLAAVEPLARGGGGLVEQVLKPAVRSLAEQGADGPSPSARLPGGVTRLMQQVRTGGP